jgi:hypothetical protein
MSIASNANQKGSYSIDAPPHSLKDSNVNPKMETIEEEGVGIHSLIRSISTVQRRAKASRWGLGHMINGSIIHTDLHSPNNKLVNAWLEHFWCTNEPQACHISDIRNTSIFQRCSKRSIFKYF